MGYTHYWKTTKVKETDYQLALNDIKSIINAYSSEVAKLLDISVELDVQNQDGIIDINGVGKLAHENFWLPSKTNSLKNFDFCKTAAKPYDVIVTACLARLSEVKGVSVSSDGELSDWDKGIKLASAVLGRPIKYKINE